MPERLKRANGPAGTSRRVRIALVDDHPAFRLGLARLLERNEAFNIAWSVSSVRQAVRMLERNPVDLVLMDLQFGDGVDGLDGMKIVRGRWPDTRVLVISAFADRQSTAAARAVGASGVVSKDSPLNVISEAIEQAASRNKVRSVSTRARPVGPTGSGNSERLAKLTPREREVLEEIRQGLTNREIALSLGVATTTVNKHVHRVLAKLGARNRAQAAFVR